MDTIRKELRSAAIRAREGLDAKQRGALSRLIAAQIAASPQFQAAKTVLLYRAVRGEVSLDALVQAPEAAGKRLAYPLCTSDTEMVALIPHDSNAWVPGYCGIPEPSPERSQPVLPEEIDLVICPCTAFDEACHRMGMGAGFYDRFLVRCSRAYTAAVAFECQKATAIPTQPWDRSMDAVFTESAVYYPKK